MKGFAADSIVVDGDTLQAYVDKEERKEIFKHRGFEIKSTKEILYKTPIKRKQLITGYTRGRKTTKKAITISKEIIMLRNLQIRLKQNVTEPMINLALIMARWTAIREDLKDMDLSVNPRMGIILKVANRYAEKDIFTYSNSADIIYNINAKLSSYIRYEKPYYIISDEFKSMSDDEIINIVTSKKSRKVVSKDEQSITSESTSIVTTEDVSNEAKRIKSITNALREDMEYLREIRVLEKEIIIIFK